MLGRSSWKSFQSFLLIEKKFKDKKTNIWAYQSRFNLTADYFNTRQWTRAEFNNYISSLKEKGLCNATINKFVSIGLLIDEFLGKKELEGYGYFRESREIKRNLVTLEEIKKMAKVAVPYRRFGKFINERQDCLLMTLAETGGRISEVLELRWENVTAEYVRFADTKSSETRDIPISAERFAKISALKRWNPQSEYVFVSGRGGPLTSPDINLDLKVRARLCAVEKVVASHDFRRRFITSCLEGGMSWFTLSFIVGHKSPETTRRYAQHLIGFYRDQLFTYHPLLRQAQTFRMVADRLKKVASESVDTSLFSLKIEEKERKLIIEVGK